MKTESVRKVCDKLAKAYGPVRPPSVHEPLDSLIQTILSQNTTDSNSHRAFTNLKEHFPTWQGVLEADPRAIASTIHQGGLAQVKSNTIKSVLARIREYNGELNLHFLRDMEDGEALEFLTDLPGVGAKTAACVLLFSLDRPVFPVDTHVYRTTRRLGWLPPSAKVEQAGPILETSIPPELTLALHLYLVAHGRRTCKARRPLCGECPVQLHCRAYREGRLP